MRLRLSSIMSAAAGTVLLLAGAAVAGEFQGGSAYADRFGNLVYHSPSGFKQIMVGQGHRVDEARAAGIGPYPEIVSADQAGVQEGRLIGRHCYSRAEFWRGRDRMYGLREGEIPQPRIICE